MSLSHQRWFMASYPDNVRGDWWPKVDENLEKFRSELVTEVEISRYVYTLCLTSTLIVLSMPTASLRMCTQTMFQSTVTQQRPNTVLLSLLWFPSGIQPSSSTLEMSSHSRPKVERSVSAVDWLRAKGRMAASRPV
jgi:hypothetical protein